MKHIFAFFSLMWVCIFSASAMDWDITDTGQPYHEATFTVTEASWMSVSVSPDGRTLLLDMLGDIYSLPAGGGKATLVHGGPAMEKMPTFSPDGSLIAYISDKGGSDNIWVSRTDGSEARQITSETTDILTSPAWDMSGEYVIATKYRDTFSHMRSSEIRMYHIEGGTGHLLVDVPLNGRDVNEANLSQDNVNLYYTERITDTQIYVDANHRNFAIKRLHLQSGSAETVVSGFGGAITPQISPDGKTLAFIRRVKDKTVLFSYNVETKEQTPVYANLDRDLQADFVPHGAYYPKYDWFPDNKHVAIWGKGKLYRVNMETAKVAEIPFSITATHRYTNVPQIKHDLAPAKVDVKAIRQLQVSPDEKELLFSAVGSLWTADINGNNVRAFASNAEGNLSDAAYSPDGKYIVYVAWTDEGGSRLELAHRDGTYIRTLARSKSAIRQPSFSKDNRKIVYTIGPGNKAMGGLSVKAEIRWVKIQGTKTVSTGVYGEKPLFNSDASRIIFTRTVTHNDTGSLYAGVNKITRLESVAPDGRDLQVHAKSTDTDLYDFTVSPDLRWLAFRKYREYHVLPFRFSGQPVEIDFHNNVPTTLLSAAGGYGLTWDVSGKTVYWLLGNQLQVASIDTVNAVTSRRINLTLQADKPKGVIAFIGGRIITMRDEEVIEDGSIVIEDNRIVALGDKGSVRIPRGATVIDATGKTIMPGLIDMHGHIDCCGGSSGPLPEKQPLRYAALAFGVTTNFDQYSTDITTYESREMQQSGRLVSPRWIATGKGIFGRKGTPDNSYVPIHTYEDAQNLIVRKSMLGGKAIKSYRQTMRKQRQMLVKAGRAKGILVDGEGENHFYNNLSMFIDGHMALEHNIPLANYYNDIVQFTAHSGVSLTPTIIVTFGDVMGENYMYQTTRAWEDPKIQSFVQETNSSYSPLKAPSLAPPYVRGMTALHAAEEIWDIGFRAVSRSVNRLSKAGVTVNTGSHGQIAGLGLHWEMWLLAEGGMKQHDILKAATVNGAKTLQVSHQIGSLAIGKLADLIVLDKNPLEDIKNSNSVIYTMVNGRLYDSYTMHEIGNYNRPRSKFYWETLNRNNIDWQQAWQE